MATSPAIASLSRCADQIQKYLTLQDAVAPGAAMVACADRLASYGYHAISVHCKQRPRLRVVQVY